MDIRLTGGASIDRNHYFNLSWNTYSVHDVDFRIYKYKSLPGYFIHQKLSDGFIPIKSIANLLKIAPVSITNYMKTFLFYSILMTKDSSIPMLGYVYLIILEDTFKIGRTANFINRYNKSTRDKAISIVPVTNPELVEQELINRFRDEDYSVSKGREYFNLDTRARVIRIFNNVVNKYILPYDSKKSVYITKFKFPSQKKEKLFVHPSICDIFINRYASTELQRSKCKKFLDLINKQISNGYFDEIYDNQNKSICSYWLYFNYIGIRRWTDNKVNISRMFNSIKNNTRSYTHHPISDFSTSIKSNRKLVTSFKKRHPDRTMIEFCENKEQPYLSGFYLDISLVPTFVSWASTDALLDMNELLLYIGSDAFTSSSTNDAKTRTDIHNYLSSKKLIMEDIFYG